MPMDTDTVAIRLCETYLADHPEEAAPLLEERPPRLAAAILERCRPDTAVTALASMAPAEAAEVLTLFADEGGEALLAEIPPSKAAYLFRRVGTEARDRLTAKLRSEQREAVVRLLHYPEGSVGAAMDPTPYALPADIDVATATQRIRRNAAAIRYYLYIVERDHRLCGVLNLRDFVLADPESRLRDNMKTNLTRVRPEMPVSAVPRLPGGAQYRSIPVVDEEELFLGVLALDAYQHDHPQHASQHAPWDTVVALSELYWVGLTGLIGGRTPSAPASAPSRTAPRVPDAPKSENRDQGDNDGT